ncbi:MAG: GNAT family N-acetyltransferase [Acidimicrobiales bacterium]|nr:GNAT family N-acetyltransferase [Acidimicrobiales bacterium]
MIESSGITGIEETARPATTADGARIAEMAAEAIQEQIDARGGAMASAREFRSLPADEDIGAAIDSADHLVLVGEFDGVGVGYAVVRLERLRTGAALAVLTDLYVHAEAREMGVGEALIGAVTEWAEDNQCIGIDSIALPGNRATKNFFETFGLKARALLVHRSLVEPQ